MKRQVVIASLGTPSNKAVVASFACQECGNHQSVTAGLSTPMCVECGSSDMKKQGKDKQVTLANPVGLTCTQCDTFNTVESKVALANNGKTHCVCCGSEMNYDTDPLEDEDNEVSIDVSDILEDEDTVESDVDDTEEGDDSDDNIGTDDDTDEGTTEVESAEDEDTDEDDEEKDTEKEDEDKKEESSVTLASVSNGSPHFILDKDNNTLYAFKGHNCIATLEDDNVSKVYKTIGKDVANNTLEVALADYGFTFNEVSVTASTLANKRIAEVTASAESNAKKAINKFQKGMMKSLVIASAGMNKGLFPSANPLKDGMIELLESHGIKGASKKVAKVFASTANEYHASLLETAQEITEKPSSVQNEYMKLIASTDEAPVDDTDEDEDMEDDNTDNESSAEITSRLLNPVQPSRTQVKSSVNNTVTSNDIAIDYNNLF